MKVIDFHVHLAKYQHFLPVILEFINKLNPGYLQRYPDGPTPQEMVDHFELQGVQQIILLAEYAPKCTGEVANETIVAFCRGVDQLTPFGSLSVEADVPYVEQARYAVEELGVRGFKLLPSYQHFYPNDPSFFPFFAYLQAEGLPVMFHTGSSLFQGTRIKYGDPLLLDDVADEFPELQIVMEHGGRPFWYGQAAWMVSRHRNVHIGLAGIPIRNIPEYFPNLERNSESFIFGSDWPAVPMEVGELIDRVLALPYSDDTKANILHRNAERLLGMAAR